MIISAHFKIHASQQTTKQIAYLGRVIFKSPHLWPCMQAAKAQMRLHDDTYLT